MNGIRRCRNLRLVERHRDHLVSPKISDVANLNRQVLARLPLNVQGVVDRVGQFIGWIVDTKREELRTVFDLCHGR